MLGDLLLNATEDVRDVLGVGDLVLDCVEDHLLGELSADERLVLAGALRGGEAAVVTAALAADLGDRGATAIRRPCSRRADVWGSGPAGSPAPWRSRACRCRPATCGALIAPLPDRLQQGLRDDLQFLVRVDDPLGLRLLEATATTGPRIPATFGAVPDPSAGVLLVVEDPADGGGRPALRRSDAARARPPR